MTYELEDPAPYPYAGALSNVAELLFARRCETLRDVELTWPYGSRSFGFDGSSGGGGAEV